MIPNTNLESRNYMTCRMQELLIQYFNKRWSFAYPLDTPFWMLPLSCQCCDVRQPLCFDCTWLLMLFQVFQTHPSNEVSYPPFHTGISECQPFSPLQNKTNPTKKKTSWETQRRSYIYIHPSLNLKQLNEKKSLRTIPASDKALSSDKPSYSMRYAQTKAGLRETPCTQCTRSVLLAFFAWQITGQMSSSFLCYPSITL